MRTLSPWLVSVALITSFSGSNLVAAEQARQPKSQAFSWMYVREKNHCIANNLSPSHAFALQESIPGEFLWYQEGGKAYLIKDPSAIAEARRHFESKDTERNSSKTEGLLIKKLSRVAIKNGSVTPMPYPPVLSK